MYIRGSNYYFEDYEEVKQFLLERNFKYEIPKPKYFNRYCVEIRNGKIVWCGVEYGNPIRNTVSFYNNDKAYLYEISDEIISD